MKKRKGNRARIVKESGSAEAADGGDGDTPIPDYEGTAKGTGDWNILSQCFLRKVACFSAILHYSRDPSSGTKDYRRQMGEESVCCPALARRESYC